MILPSSVLSFVKKIYHYFMYNYYYHGLCDCYDFIYRRLASPKKIISKIYREHYGKELNWDNPRDLNEKINWLKINSDTSEWTRLADKYKVREYVKECGLEHILVRLYARYDKIDEIDFDLLPNSFVIKMNNGCGDIIIVEDKSKMDKKAVIQNLKKNIGRKYGYRLYEPHYFSIKPCIIIEELLKDESNEYSSSLVDYKIWCFDGKPYYISVMFNRDKNGVMNDTRDLNWINHAEKSIFTEYNLDGKGMSRKPKCLKQMLDYAGILSRGFPEVRVDFYEVDGKVYFGEMTFTSSGGFNDYFTQDFLDELGDMIDLTKVTRI